MTTWEVFDYRTLRILYRTTDEHLARDIAYLAAETDYAREGEGYLPLYVK